MPNSLPQSLVVERMLHANQYPYLNLLCYVEIKVYSTVLIFLFLSEMDTIFHFPHFASISGLL